MARRAAETDRGVERDDELETRSEQAHGESNALATQLLTLQHTAGNQAANRFVQTKLIVGAADDPYEREADRIASVVMGGRTPPAPTPGRAADDGHAEARASRDATDVRGSFAATKDLATYVKGGGGAPLPDTVRRDLEPRFGVDFGEVRVHTDDKASSMAASIGASAFTHGNDVYFGRGTFQPHSPGGQHLLAHELTHVLQQTGSAHRKISRSFDGSLVPTRLAERRIQGNFLKKMNEKRKQFFGKSDKDVREKTKDENIDNMSKGDLQTYMQRTKGGGPSENPDWSNPKLFAKTPNKFKVKLAVAQEDANWLKNMKSLRNEGYKAIFSSEGRAALGAMDKEWLIKKALENQGALDGMTDAEIKTQVDKFTEGMYDVGHTWIRLETYVDNELKDLYSYGMWPAKIAEMNDSGDNYGGFAGPVSLGQGEIRHPDNVHEGDAMTAYFAHGASKKQFDSALELAATRYQSPPPYVLVGYNCTTFAREIFQAGGGTYPAGGRLLPGFAYTPGNLYKAIMEKVAEDEKKKDKGKKVGGKATKEDEHKDLVDKGKAKQAMLAEAGKRDTQSETFATPKPNAKTQTLHFFAPNSFRYGVRPDFATDSKISLDKDRDMVAVDSPEAADRFGVFTFWMGPKKYWYILEDDVNDAMEEQKPTKKAGVMLPLYTGTGGGFKPPASGEKPNRTIDQTAFFADIWKIDQTAGEWINIAGLRGGEFWWVRKTHYDYFSAPSTTPIPKDLLGDGGAPSGSGSGGPKPPQFPVTKDGVPFYNSWIDENPTGLLSTSQVSDDMLDFDPFQDGWVVTYVARAGGVDYYIKKTDYDAWCKLTGRKA
ncbi:MAG TPA: DUF4157 domain-containing protein [Acidimicrobiales bacterium]